MGGSTLDVTLFDLEVNMISSVANSRDSHLGGVDFDLKLTEHFVQVFFEKHKIDIKSNIRAFNILKSEAEKAKRILSI